MFNTEEKLDTIVILKTLDINRTLKKFESVKGVANEYRIMLLSNPIKCLNWSIDNEYSSERVLVR